MKKEIYKRSTNKEQFYIIMDKEIKVFYFSEFDSGTHESESLTCIFDKNDFKIAIQDLADYGNCTVSSVNNSMKISKLNKNECFNIILSVKNPYSRVISFDTLDFNPYLINWYFNDEGLLNFEYD